ncbi:MAG: hypothetical protein L3J62_04150 [Gammaproteobacteria bacterium]|nr:hypothetical protein [Gammaproteobacteria bacterium]MCF6229975.1 hypothetical protein [Gammaproteobacteria bacterium]
MKKILICLLLLANLSLGLAYAWDIHPEAAMGHDLLSVDLSACEQHDHSEGDLHNDNHCGHGSAHLVGLVFTQTTPFAANSKSDFLVPAQTPHSLYIAPLLRPPIA